MSGSIKIKGGSWVVLKSGDKIKTNDGSWVELKGGDKIKDRHGNWHDLGVGPSITISTSPENLEFDSLGKISSYVTVTIEGSTMGYKVDTSNPPTPNPADWIITTITTNDQLRVKCKENPSPLERSSDITIQSVEDNTVKAYISVFQSGS